MLHVPYDEPGRIGVGWPRPEFADEPDGYFTDAGLRALIRDPRSVRIWPEQRMPGFAQEDLSDEELGLILAYLSHMADRRAEQRRVEAANAK
jgi:cytochrome c1